jgi:alkylated DNA nucleotide flippase Atl1
VRAAKVNLAWQRFVNQDSGVQPDEHRSPEQTRRCLAEEVPIEEVPIEKT